MKKATTFESLIEDLKFLVQQESRQRQEHQKYLETSLSSFIEEIKPLYQEEKQRLFEEISLFRQNYAFLKSESILEYLNKEKETNHSKVLACIWKNNPQILCDFIESIPRLSVSEQLREWILEGNYQVETEQNHTDILITDNQKRYCIVVENKINSPVSYHKEGKLQLDSYYKYVNKIMPRTAVKLCILLSHRNNRKYTVRNDWYYADYFCVCHSLINNYSEGIKDYLISVYSLLFPNKETGDNINEESSIVEMSRFYQEIITKIK